MHLTVILAAAIALAEGSVSAQVLFVDDDATPGGDGLAWATAFQSLQDALAAARTPKSGVVEIRVGQGRYVPDQEPFDLVDGVALRGGYAGVGAPDPDARDPAAYPTILDGDADGDDGDYSESCCSPHGTGGCAAAACAAQVCQELPSCCETSWDLLCVAIAMSSLTEDCDINADCPDIQDNVPVITAGGTGPGTILDGFTITRGRRGFLLDSGSATIEDCTFTGNTDSGIRALGPDAAAEINGCTFSENAFSGVLSSNATVTITGSVFTANAAYGGGGGINSSGGEILVTDCTLTGNSAYRGGGLSMDDGAVIGCTFSGNVAGAGGGLSLSGQESRAIGCIFEGNSATDTGGGAYVIQASTNYPTTIVNSLFSGNAAETGAGVTVWGGDPAALVNCTLSGNVASMAGGAVSGTYLDVVNCVLWGNVPDEVDVSFVEVLYSDVQGGYAGVGNIDADPLFLAPGAGDYRLAAGSPCIDAGHSQTLLPSGIGGIMKILCDEADLDGDGDTMELIPVDLDGLLRCFDDPATPDTGCAAGPIIDMGACEYDAPASGPRVVQADVDGDGEIGVQDLLIMLAEWGACDDPCCVADFGGVVGNDPCKFGLPYDGVLTRGDLHSILELWGQ